jgi:hypothetical protein
MSEPPISREHGPRVYEIRISGHLAPRRAASFEGLTLSHADGGTTVIRGLFADQAALHGVLARVRDMALPLISVSPVDPVIPRSTET